MSPDVVSTEPAVRVDYNRVRETVHLATALVAHAQVIVDTLGNVGLWIPGFPSPSAADYLAAAHNDLRRMQNAVEAARHA